MPGFFKSCKHPSHNKYYCWSFNYFFGGFSAVSDACCCTSVSVACLAGLVPLLAIFSHFHLPLLSMRRRASIVLKLCRVGEEPKHNVRLHKNESVHFLGSVFLLKKSQNNAPCHCCHAFTK